MEGSDDMPDDYDTNWIKYSNFMPQVEIFNHRATAVAFIHGGFGGCMESLQAGLPSILFPHHDDQPSNSELMEETGCSIRLAYYPQCKIEPEYNDRGRVNDPCFTKEDVVNKLNELLTNP